MFALLANPAARPVLSSQDHALLALISERNFNLTLAISHAPDAHPAQQSHLTLTRWLKLSHIDTVVRELIADLNRYSTYTAQLLHNASILTLNTVVERASQNLALLEECSTHQPQHTRAVEEYRLAAQALYRATKPNPSPRTPTSPRPPRPHTSKSHSSRSSSSSSPHREAVEMNSRGSSRSDTPGKNPPTTSPRSPDAQTADNISLSPDPFSDHCESAPVPDSPSFKSEISNLNSPSSASSLHHAVVKLNRRGSWRSHTPGEVTQNELSRSRDAQACDNDSPSTNPSPNHAASLTFNFQLSSFNSPPDTFNSHPP